MLEKRILEGQEKIDTLRAELEFLPVGTTLDSKIRCKLCGHEFFYKDAYARELLDVAGYYELTVNSFQNVMAAFKILKYFNNTSCKFLVKF